VGHTAYRTFAWLDLRMTPPAPAPLCVAGALLDPFWVGRRGDEFDQFCR
jgi:hypothetical protein